VQKEDLLAKVTERGDQIGETKQKKDLKKECRNLEHAQKEYCTGQSL